MTYRHHDGVVRPASPRVAALPAATANPIGGSRGVGNGQVDHFGTNDSYSMPNNKVLTQPNYKHRNAKHKSNKNLKNKQKDTNTIQTQKHKTKPEKHIWLLRFTPSNGGHERASVSFAFWLDVSVMRW